MNIFAPNYYVQSFKTLNIQKLHEMGIQLLLCDIDNTLVAYDEECPNQDVIDFIKEFLIYEEVSVNDKNYLLVHGGLGNYSPEKDIDDYSLHELIWSRADYNIQYFSDKYVITGHTPTQAIRNNPNPGYIYRQNNHIAIDCGATYPGGRLAAICLDTGEEYYSEPNKMGSDAIGL